MPKLEPIVNQEPKEQLVPTFNKKEVEKIIDERANEENAPLGYIFIDIVTETDQDERMIVQKGSDFEKLYSLLESPSKITKPIFIKLYDSTQDMRYMGFARLEDTDLVLGSLRSFVDEDIHVVYFN